MDMNDGAHDFYKEELGTVASPFARTTPAPSPSPSPSIPTGGQQNKVSQFPMPAHPVAQEHFDAVRQHVQQEYKGKPNVLAVSDEMGANRVKYSQQNPGASDQAVIHHMQKDDSQLQFQKGCEGKVTAKEARDMPATSTGFFAQSLLDPAKRPQTGRQVLDAATAATVGFSGQMLNGYAPGNQFSGNPSESLDRLD